MRAYKPKKLPQTSTSPCKPLCPLKKWISLTARLVWGCPCIHFRSWINLRALLLWSCTCIHLRSWINLRALIVWGCTCIHFKSWITLRALAFWGWPCIHLRSWINLRSLFVWGNTTSRTSKARTSVPLRPGQAYPCWNHFTGKGHGKCIAISQSKNSIFHPCKRFPSVI